MSQSGNRIRAISSVKQKERNTSIDEFGRSFPWKPIQNYGNTRYYQTIYISLEKVKRVYHKCEQTLL
jgi:hypothetical protein